MRFIISTEKAKRELIGPFGMIASRKDFEHLRDTIQSHLDDPSWYYGSTYVDEPVERRHHPCNTKVITWEEEAKVVPIDKH